jgi:hypothetical protein
MTDQELQDIGTLAVKRERLERRIAGARRQMHDGQIGWHNVREQEHELDATIAELRQTITRYVFASES